MSEIIHLIFYDARAKARKVDRPLILIRGRLGRFEDSGDGLRESGRNFKANEKLWGFLIWMGFEIIT